MASLLNDPNIVSAWKKARNKANITKAWNPFKHHAKVGSKLQDWQGALRDFRYELQESLKDSAKDDESSVKSKDLGDQSAVDKVYFSRDLKRCIEECCDKLDKLKSALQQMDGKVRRSSERSARRKKTTASRPELDAFEQLIGDLLESPRQVGEMERYPDSVQFQDLCRNAVRRSCGQDQWETRSFIVRLAAWKSVLAGRQ